jgi:hypothetical protein
LHIIIIVGVIDDDYFAVTRRPEDFAVEVAKSFLANSSSREVSTTGEEGPLTGVALEALPCSNTKEQRRRDEISNGDPGGGGDPDGIGDSLCIVRRGLPSAEGERSRLAPFLFSIGG